MGMDLRFRVPGRRPLGFPIWIPWKFCLIQGPLNLKRSLSRILALLLVPAAWVFPLKGQVPVTGARELTAEGLAQMHDEAYPAALDSFTRALAMSPGDSALEADLAGVCAAMA